MKLSEALAKLKSLKGQLARIEGLLAEAAVHFEDAKPEYIYSEECEARAALVQEILDLKVRIQITNATSLAPLPDGGEATLAYLILKNATLRSDLAHLNKMLEVSTEETSRYASTARTTTTIKKVYAEGFSKKEIRSLIDEGDSLKQRLESILASANLTTNLVEA